MIIRYPVISDNDWGHTALEGVKISLQFPNNELCWVWKSTFQGLKKYVFQKNPPTAFRENWLKPLKNWYLATFVEILNILISQLFLSTHIFLLQIINILNPLFWYSAIHLVDISQHNIGILYLRNNKVTNNWFMQKLQSLVLYIYTRSTFNDTTKLPKCPKESYQKFKYLFLDYFLRAVISKNHQLEKWPSSIFLIFWYGVLDYHMKQYLKTFWPNCA